MEKMDNLVYQTKQKIENIKSWIEKEVNLKEINKKFFNTKNKKDDFLEKNYIYFSDEELILGLIEAITDFKLKLRSILEILCNFGGLYEINIEDIYKEYFKIWKNEMEM